MERDGSWRTKTPLTKQSQVHVKRNNLQLVLSTIIRHEPLSRADIVRHTHISKPAISNLIDYLLKRGIVSEVGEGRSSGGRKPILLKFRSDRRHFLAFEMGRTGFRAAVSDLKGRFIGVREGVFPQSSLIADRLILLKNHIFDLLHEKRIAKEKLLKIICIAPGIYVAKDKALKWTPSYQAQEGQELSDFFQGVFQREIMVNHSTKLSLLGEKIAGKAKGYDDVVYVDFAFGLGCAIMIDGSIYFGAQSSAGEIGYFYSSLEEHLSYPIEPYELGCLEKWISGKALQNRASEALREGAQGKIAELVKREPDALLAKTLFDAYRLGDPAASSILRQAFAYFNLALCNVINLLAPELVILGGGFSRAGDVLLELVSGGIRDRVLVMPRLEISDLKNEASLIGGVQYLLDHTDFLKEL